MHCGAAARRGAMHGAHALPLPAGARSAAAKNSPYFTVIYGIVPGPFSRRMVSFSRPKYFLSLCDAQ
jgi:hypothetical protein